MRFECNFGSLGSGKAGVGNNAKDGKKFRIALMGDFSGRAMTGKLDTGDDLAKRKPIRVDIDNLDDVIERMGITIRLPMGQEDESVELEIESIDDLHPDELFDKIEVFEELKSMRSRLLNDRTAKAAAAEICDFVEDLDPELRRRLKSKKKRRGSRGSTVPVGGKLSDFARLTGRAITQGDNEPDVEELVKSLIAPYIVADQDPDLEAVLAAVDESLSGTMRSILHQDDFQELEAIWRGVDFLVRRLETNSSLQLVLYDISAEELAADLSGSDELEETGLYKLLVEQPAMDAAQGSLAVLLGHYVFEEMPPHAELLGRMAKIAAAAEAPFVSAISKQVIDRKRGEEPHPLIVEAWTTLRELPEANYIALTTPKFLLRLPYGKKTDPVDAFAFEEFTPRTGVSGMLWGNGALLVGLMLGQTYSKQGLAKMQLGSIMSFSEMPYHYFTDSDGDQVALPCTDRLLSQRMAESVIAAGFIPVLSVQGQPVVRLGSIRGVGGVEIAGIWPASAEAAEMRANDRQKEAERESELLAMNRSRQPSEADGVTDDLMHDMKDGSFDDDDDDDDDDSSDDDDDMFGSSSDDDDDDLFGSSDDDSSSDDDDDFSSMLGDDDDDSDSDSDDDSDSSDGDDDLSALLASLGADDDDESSDDESDSDDEGMDPDLAALLADL